MKKYILLIAEESHIGGANTVIEELSKQLVALGHKVIILQALRENGANWTKKNVPKSVVIYNYKLKKIGGFSQILEQASKQSRELSRIAKLHHIDAILLNYPLSGAVACFHWSLRSIPKLYLFHGSSPQTMWSQIPSPRKHLLLGWMKRYLFSGPIISLIAFFEWIALCFSKQIVVFSEYAATELPALVSKRNMVFSQLGVNDSMFYLPRSKKEIRSELGFSKDETVLLCTSRFEPRKGITQLLEALALLNKSKSDFKLILTTPYSKQDLRNDYFKSIAKLVHRLKLAKSLTIISNATRSELLKYYQSADIFVLPSKKLESFGLVVLEAMACGLPTICYKSSGAPPSIVGMLSTSLIFDTYTPSHLALCIQNAKAKIDQSNALSKKSLLIAQKYPWEKTAMDIEKIIQSL